MKRRSSAPIEAEASPARERLAAVAAELGVALDEAQLGRLLAYLVLLQRWNAVYNLTALRNPQTMLSHHLADCLALVMPLRRHGRSQALRILDVGSGGGLPGVVLAIATPGWSVCCVDASAKKAAFVSQVAAELQLTNLVAVHGRVEALARPASFDVITARAFASLGDFVRMTEPLLAPQGVWVAMKGRPAADELEACGPTAELFHVEPLLVPGLAEQRCLVWMRRPADRTSG